MGAGVCVGTATGDGVDSGVSVAEGKASGAVGEAATGLGSTEVEAGSAGAAGKEVATSRLHALNSRTKITHKKRFILYLPLSRMHCSPSNSREPPP